MYVARLPYHEESPLGRTFKESENHRVGAGCDGRREASQGGQVKDRQCANSIDSRFDHVELDYNGWSWREEYHAAFGITQWAAERALACDRADPDATEYVTGCRSKSTTRGHPRASKPPPGCTGEQ